MRRAVRRAVSRAVSRAVNQAVSGAVSGAVVLAPRDLAVTCSSSPCDSSGIGGRAGYGREGCRGVGAWVSLASCL